MEIITNLFKGSTLLNIIFFLLALISIILAIIFYYNSLRIKKPVFSKQTFRLVNNKLSTIKNIEIKYNDLLLTNLSLTKIAIWNSGKESIRKSDIAENDLLRILSTDKNIIYDCEIINQNDVNNIKVTKENEKLISITFDFLDFNEGFILNIYHSGNFSNDLIVKGTLIGAKKITEGVKLEYFSKKLDIISIPTNYFLNHEEKLLRAFGWISTLPLAIILFPLFLITLPIDFIIDKTINKIPKDFYFFDK